MKLGLTVFPLFHVFRAAYHRIDPKNACRVEVTVNSYFSIVHGKKVYNRGRDVSWVVDSEKYSVINLEFVCIRACVDGFFVRVSAISWCQFYSLDWKI